MRDNPQRGGEKPPLVILAGPYAPDRQSSMERYAQLVQECLRSLPFEHVFLRPQVHFGRLLNVLPRWRNHLSFIDKFIIFPRQIARMAKRHGGARQVLLHVLDQGNSPCAPSNLPCPLITTCHDLIAAKSVLGDPPSAPASKSLGHWFHSKVVDTLRRSQAILCVSDKTLQECLGYLKVAPASLRRVYSPLDPFFSRQAEPQPTNHRDVVLHVGNSAWYKNRPGLFRIYAELRKQLPSCPALHLYGEPLRDEEHRLLQELNLDEDVVCHPHPSHEEIRSAYHRAKVFMFPSLEEGFGWPPLEAIACGCPVFTSNLAPMTEVGADAFQYFDPSDPAAAASKIASFLQLNEEERVMQVERGYARAGFFNMQQFTMEMSKVYTSAFLEAGPSHQVNLT